MGSCEIGFEVKLVNGVIIKGKDFFFVVKGKGVVVICGDFFDFEIV